MNDQAKPRRIVFMGTPDFAVVALAALVAAGHDIAAVYTQPPRRAGRGQSLKKSPVHLFAEDRGFPVFTPQSLKKDAEAQAGFIAHFNKGDDPATVAVVAAYGLILPQAVLTAPRYGCINIHASLLPRWRGAAPIQRAIMAGDATSGISIMQMDEGLDTGPVLIEESTPITAETTAQSLHDVLAEIGGRLIVAAISRIDTLTPRPQPQDGITYAHMLDKDDGRIDWMQPADIIERQSRALTPWPGVWCLLPGGGRLKVLGLGVAEPALGTPGTLMDEEGLVACGGGTALRLGRVQPENRNPMTFRDAINGGLLKKGDRLQ